MDEADATTVDKKPRFFDGDTNKSVTFVILVAYIVLLAGFLIASVSNPEKEDEWFDLVKLGFTTMGSALTLVLGYYFGQREVAAIKDREVVKRKLEEANAEKNQKVSGLVEMLKRESSSSQPDTIESVAKLPTGRPQRDN